MNTKLKSLLTEKMKNARKKFKFYGLEGPDTSGEIAVSISGGFTNVVDSTYQPYVTIEANTYKIAHMGIPPKNQNDATASKIISEFLDAAAKFNKDLIKIKKRYDLLDDIEASPPKSNIHDFIPKSRRKKMGI